MTASVLHAADWGQRRDVNRQLTPTQPTRNGSTFRPKRTRRRREDVENDAYVAFVARVIAAAGRRVAIGDVDALPDLARLVHDLEAALLTAVTGLRAFGYSWEQIATRLGVTRQAAQQRWGTP